MNKRGDAIGEGNWDAHLLEYILDLGILEAESQYQQIVA